MAAKVVHSPVTAKPDSSTKTGRKAERRRERKRTGAMISEELFRSAEAAFINYSREMARRFKTRLDEGSYASEIVRLNFEKLYRYFSDIAEGRRKVRL